MDHLVLLLVVGGDLVLLDHGDRTLEVGAAGTNLAVGALRAHSSALSVHLIDLLEREQTGFVDEEVGKGDTTGAGTGPDEEHLGTEASVAGAGLDKVWSGVTDTEVPEPVGSSAERESLGTDGEGEDLSTHDPGGGTPGGGETGDVYADESDESLATRGVGAGNRDTDNGNDKLAKAHPNGTPDEEVSSTDALHHVHAWKSSNDVDDVGDDREDEGVGAGKSTLEELGTKVKDEVDTSELLEGLEEDTGE